jgi:hypothetical protein
MSVNGSLDLSLSLHLQVGRRGEQGKKESEPNVARYKQLPSMNDPAIFKGFNTAGSLGPTYPPDLKKEADI